MQGPGKPSSLLLDSVRAEVEAESELDLEQLSDPELIERIKMEKKLGNSRESEPMRSIIIEYGNRRLLELLGFKRAAKKRAICKTCDRRAADKKLFDTVIEQVDALMADKWPDETVAKGNAIANAASIFNGYYDRADKMKARESALNITISDDTKGFMRMGNLLTEAARMINFLADDDNSTINQKNAYWVAIVHLREQGTSMIKAAESAFQVEHPEV